jgi:hypothetical protein
MARFVPSEDEVGEEYLAAALRAAGVESVEGLRAADKPPPAGGVLQRKPRKPTLASIVKQARKAAIEVARYEIKPDGTIAVITGKSESTESNPWLDDLR